MSRSVKALLLCLATALPIAIGLIAWQLSPTTHTFLSDGETIHQPVATALTRDILWQPPVELAQEILSAEQDDYEPRLSWDGLSLYFVRGKAGENADIYVSTRTVDGWTDPTLFDSINSEYDDLGPEPTADGKALYFYSNRPGGRGGYDLWVSHRGPTGWRPAINLGPAVNSEFNEYGPAVTPDGDGLYFASNRPQPDDEEQVNPDAWPATIREDLYFRDYDLYFAAIADGEVAQAGPLPALNTPYNEGVPCVSPVGDFIYFASDRPAGFGGYDLYRSRRLDGGHRRATNLGSEVNSQANDLDPGMSLGGYALYFSSDRPIERIDPQIPNDYDLYQTTSREVFSLVETEHRPPIHWAALWDTIGPNLLWLLLLLLVLLLLLALWRAAKDRQLSLLARCLLASLMAHLILLMLLNTWQVGLSLADAWGGGKKIRVALAGAAGAGDLTAQIRGEFTQTDAPAPAEMRVERGLAQLKIPVTLAMATMPVNHLTEQPQLESMVRLASTDASVPPRESALANQPALSVPWPVPLEMAVPREANRMDAAETQAATSPVSRAHLRAPTQEMDPPAELLRQVVLAPVAHETHTDTVATASLAHQTKAKDATPSMTQPTLMPIGLAVEMPEPLRVAVPRVEERWSLLRDEAQPAVPTETSLIPYRKPLRLDTNSATPVAIRRIDPAEVLHIPPMTTLVSISTADLRDAFPSPQDRQPIREMPNSWPGIRNPATLKVELPMIPELTAEVAAEPISTVVAATPESMRPENPMSADSIAENLPNRLFDVSPTDRLDDPHARSESLVDRAEPAASMDPFQPNQALASSSRPTMTVPPMGLNLSIPDEIQPPENPYSQRAPEVRQEMLEQMGGSEETERAVAAALQWLSSHQSPDGRWAGDRFDERCGRCGGETDVQVDVATTGLSLLCFLGADHTHVKEGPYRADVERAINWLLRRQQADGDLRGGETMYSHGIAAIALAEAYTMTEDPRLADPLRRAMEFIDQSRNQRVGGWRYDPGQPGDTSVLGWQVMALTSGERGGVEVPQESYESAREWLDRVSNRAQPGLYAYKPGRRYTPSMTAEGMFVQQLLGVPHEDPRMQTAVDYLAQNPPDWDGDLNTYYWYYATLALFQYRGPAWEQWNETLTEQLLTHQRVKGRAAGSWDPEGEWAPIGGRIYQTALCTLMLEVYYRYLPMYAVDGP